MKNPLGLSIIGSAVIAILCGIAGANYQPKAAQQARALTEAPSAEAAVTPPETAPVAE